MSLLAVLLLLAAPDVSKSSFAIAVEPNAPIGDVRPGNSVDLIVLRSRGKGSEAVVVLQNVPVESATPEAVTVLLTAAEEKHLALAIETGVIRVALRSLWDGNTQEPIGKVGTTSPLPLRNRSAR